MSDEVEDAQTTRRRGRPSAVEPGSIVDAATRMIEQRGIDGFSMRGLAEELGVWPMTIYNHFENKNAVLDAVADSFLGSIPLPPPDEVAWDRWIEQFGEVVYEAWAGHPRLLAVVMARPGRGVSIANMLGVFLDVLRDAGFSADQAHSAWHAVQNHLFGEVYQIVHWGQSAERRASRGEAVDRVLIDHPLRDEWGDFLEACDRPAEFRIGLRILIRGLRAGLPEH